MCFRSESLAVYSCMSARVSSRDGIRSLTVGIPSPLKELPPFVLLCRLLPRRIRCRGRADSPEIYEPFYRVCREQLDFDLVSDVDAFFPAHQPPFYRRIDDPYVSPRRLVAGDDRLEALSDSIAEQDCCRDLPHLPLDLARRVLLHRAVPRNLRELVVAVRRRRACQYRFYYSLRHQIGVAPVRRRR